MLLLQNRKLCYTEEVLMYIPLIEAQFVTAEEMAFSLIAPFISQGTLSE